MSKGHTKVAKHFPKISEDYQRLPKTLEEDPKIFWLYINIFKYNLRDKGGISEIIDIFTGEDIENKPLKSRRWFCMNFTRGVFSSKTLLFI